MKFTQKINEIIFELWIMTNLSMPVIAMTSLLWGVAYLPIFKLGPNVPGREDSDSKKIVLEMFKMMV